MANDEAGGGAAVIDDPALGAEPGEAIRTLESGVTVKKSGAAKDAIDIRGAGQDYLKTLDEANPAGAKAPRREATGRFAKRDAPPAERRPAPVREERHPSARRPAEEEEVTETEEEREEREEAEERERLEAEDRERAAARRTKPGEKPKPAERPKPKTETAEERAEREEREELLANETEEEREEREQREAEELEPIKIVLKGLSERGEDDLELEVDDPAIAERIQRAENSGMRRRQYEEAMLAVEDRADELEAVVQAIGADPVGYALNHMTPVRQVEVLKALLLEHMDEVGDYIDELASDPAARATQRVKLRDERKGQADMLARSTANQKAAKRVIAAASQLIPDDVADEERTSFLADAEADFIREVRAGRAVTPESVPRILARRLKLYGFPTEPPRRVAERESRGNGTPSRNGAARARPLTPRAQELDARERDRVARIQTRIRSRTTAGRAAARVAQPGAGAGAISEPIVPPTADIREASRALRKGGKLSGGWTNA